jgi:ABC-2 type transport system permease protein
MRVEGVLEVTERGVAAGGASVELQVQDRKVALPAALRAIRESGGTVEELQFEAISWDEVFERLGASAGSAGISPGAASQPAAERVESPSDVGPADLNGPALREVKGALRKALLFLRRDLKEQASYRLSFILQFLGIFFSVASFYFVGQLFGAQAAPYLSNYGGNYFSFVLIGIAFVGYQGVALYTFSGIIQSAQTAGTLEAMLVTPTRLSTILTASSLWNFAFTSFRIVVYLLMGVAVFGADLRHANLLSGLVILLLTILASSGIGILSASFVMVFKRGDPVNFLIGSLSSLLSGVYYPVEVLPAWLQVAAHLFPLTYALAAMRRALLLGEPLAALWREALALAAFSALLLPLGLLAFRLAVRQAKKDGSLTQF